MTRCRITVITPNQQHAQMLERTICSVLDQGCRGLQYIVVDGGLEPEVGELLNLYQPDLSWCGRAERGIVLPLINQAIARAEGDLIMILPSGDLLLPGAMDEIFEEYKRNFSGWMVGQCLHVDEDDQPEKETMSHAPQSLASYLRHDSGHLPMSASVYARDLFRSHGLFNLKLPRAYSYDWHCRLLASGHWPMVLKATLAMQRHWISDHTAQETLWRGLEQITAAETYADRLPLTQRLALWQNCDQRRRIYALADAETRHASAQGQLWSQLFRRPWWLTDESFRRTLLNGVAHPAPAA